jgi:hypothetical protein
MNRIVTIRDSLQRASNRVGRGRVTRDTHFMRVAKISNSEVYWVA